METLSHHFTDLSIPKNRLALSLNSATPVLLTQAILPKLTERVSSNRAPGASFGLRPSPHVNVYAATKSLVNYFSQGLSVEFAETLDVLLTHPLGVSSAMVDKKPDGLVIITPQQCVKASLQKLGTTWGRHWTNGWWFHEIQWALMSNAPDFVFNKIVKHSIPLVVSTNCLPIY
jgi:short-subunit dehydrogenase